MSADAALATDPAGGRIARRFAALAAEGRGGLVTFVTACDPDQETSQAILEGLPQAGADFIELGMPFTDPMADGPAIQASSLRALEAGASMARTLDMVRRFRDGDQDTPVVLMGYFNPIYSYGADRFAADAAEAGVDGLIVVDLPPEESDELQPQAAARGIDFIRLATPTSDDQRLPTVVGAATGFIYYVSILGITGTRSAEAGDLKAAMTRLRRHTDLPIAIGFGIKTPDQAAEIARIADAAVVGSALVQAVADSLDDTGRAGPGTVTAVLDRVGALADGVRGARR